MTVKGFAFADELKKNVMTFEKYLVFQRIQAILKKKKSCDHSSFFGEPKSEDNKMKTVGLIKLKTMLYTGWK